MYSIRDALLTLSFTMQVAFKTGDFKQQVIFIGGLTDGFMATEYVSIESVSVIEPFICLTCGLN